MEILTNSDRQRTVAIQALLFSVGLVLFLILQATAFVMAARWMGAGSFPLG